MKSTVSRRRFLGNAGVIAASGVVASSATGEAEDRKSEGRRIKILGIGCSPRVESSTAAAVQACLDAAKEVDPARIDVELIKLGGLRIPAEVAAGVKLEPGERDDFPKIAPKLSDPAVAGLIIGSPVYFSNMSALCKAFLERLMEFRQAGFALSNKVAGVLAVGGARNGGQELTIRSIQNSLFSQEMIIVGESRPSAHFGPGVWNTKEFKKITDDTVGMATVRNLGKRVAHVALALARSRVDPA